MSKTAKVLVTILILVVFTILFAAITGATGGGPSFIALILFAGLIGAIRAIWKKPKQTEESDMNDSTLQK